jgi:agmatine deiminase
MKKFTLLVLILIIVGSLAQAETPQPIQDWPADLPLPAWQTPQEKQMPPQPADDVTPPPTEPVVAVPEFGPQEGVQLVYGFANDPMFVDLVREIQEVAVVYVVVPDIATMSQCNSVLQANQVPLTNVEYQIHATDAYWSRDYGAHYVWGQNSGEIAMIDWQYYDSRPNDDAIPQFQAGQWHMNYYESPIYHEGGNYMSDGHGLVMCSDVLYSNNPTYSQAWCQQQLAQYFGAQEIHIYERIPSYWDGTGHIDLWGKMLNDTTIMVAQMQPDDPNYQMIENHATAMGQVLTHYGRPFNIVRCPMPPSYVFLIWHYYKSFLNSTIVNGKVLVPIYNTEPLLTTQALAAYQAAMPDYEVVGIYCDPIAWQGGAIHCTTIGVADHIQDYVHSADVTVTPVNPPIVIPPGGGSFSYNANLHNLETDSIYTEIWAEIVIPSGYAYGPVLQRSVNLAANGTVSRMMSQAVPGTAPAGNYIFKMYTGSRLPRVVNDSSYFSFTKSGAEGPFGGDLTGWYWTEEETTPQVAAQEALPASYDLLNVSPNPFNPSTSMSYQLTTGSLVRLSIYDITGKLVSILVEGHREAGVHQTTFDGSALASGIYFAKLEAGNLNTIEKLILMK